MTRLCALLTLLFLFAVPASPAAAGPTTPLRRFGLFVGKNDGGTSRPKLRYAVSDATAISQVLEQLGGLERADSTLLSEPTLAELEAAIATQIERVRSAQTQGQRTELVFYYSGHSDQRGVLLGEALVPYETLKQWLEQIPAEVRIVLLDSCSSGTLTRLKGGAHKPPFLFDQSIEVRGHAILTASAEDEAAQESDRIRGSFFTHYLISGMRGAADTSADGRVTLTEAYRFAFDETLARTGTTKAGAQHPSYDIQLAGTGDLVMTDLRETRASLELGPDVLGHVFVRDEAGHLVAELNKSRGVSVRLGFAPGRYALLLEREAERGAAQVTLRALSTVRVTAANFADVPLEIAVARGGTRRLVPVGVALVPPYDTYGRGPDVQVDSYLGLHALYGETDGLTGVQLALGANGAMSHAEGLQLAGVANRAARMRGMQIAVAGNGARQELMGLQLSGVGNLTRGELRGAQLAWVYNGAASLVGLQVGSINVTRQPSYGLAFGGLNVARDLTGAQVGFVNWSRQQRGVQVSMLNLARDVTGLQAGFVNIARGEVSGVQLGLLNYADRADAGLGPISITRDGGVHAQLVCADISAFQLAVRFDARYTYSFFGGGYHPFGNERQRSYLLGGGFGGKVPVFRMLSAELDAGAYVAQPLLEWMSGAPNALAQLRLMARIEIHKHLSVLLGASFNLLFQADAQRALTPGFPNQQRHRATERDDSVQVHYDPGWVIGLRL